MAQATAQRDTRTASVVNISGSSMMVGMTLMAVPERDHAEPETLAEVHRLPDPFAPTPEEVAAKKARRRMDNMTQTADRYGVNRARFFNQAGYDVWGYNERGQYDPAQRFAPDTRKLDEEGEPIGKAASPFPHH